MRCYSIAGYTPPPPAFPIIFSWKFAGTDLHSQVERGIVRVKCLAQEHNTIARPGLDPRPLDPDPGEPNFARLFLPL